MTLTRMFDAAFPPETAPPNCGAVLGYIGRAGDATRVWTLADWQRFASLRQLPCWVPDFANDPRDEARAACGVARTFGWADHLPAELTRAIVFDFELLAGAERAWWAECSDEIHVQGFAGIAYGSESTVFELAASWVFLAAWNGQPVMLGEGQTVVAHQYAAGVRFGGTQIDLSVISPWLLERCGTGPRKLVSR